MRPMDLIETTPPPVGHNAQAATLAVEVRLFNAMQKYAGPEGWRLERQLPAGATIGDLVQAIGLPAREIFLIMLNGRDVTGGLVGDPVNLQRTLEDGDVVAFSGPVPYSFGFGAPVV